MTSTDLDGLLEEVVDQERREAGDHLRDADLLAYHEGQLQSEARSAAREHLTHCDECRQLLLALDAAKAESTAAEAEAQAASHALEEFQARLRSERTAPIARRPLSGWWKAAALVLAASNLLLLSWISFRQPPSLAGAGNLLIEDIYPIDDVWRDGGPKVIRIDTKVDLVGFLIHLSPTAGGSRHKIQLLNSDGETLWHSESLIVDDHGIASVAIPAELLSTGSYRLRVGGEHLQEFQELEVMIETAEP